MKVKKNVMFNFLIISGLKYVKSLGFYMLIQNQKQNLRNYNF